jgi:pimeloyl-ACP methyl ester carboxylesterase
MTARFKRIVMWSFIGLNVLFAVLAYAMRDNLFRAMIEPALPFQVDEQPSPPDYNDAAAWAVRPQGTSGSSGQADIFFIHPTTAWSGAAGWNADIGDPVSRTRLEDVALPNHAEPYSSAGSLWVPRYRQAVLYASLARREDSREALNFAYGDVARAFDVFMKARDPSRPLVLVGVGQGGLHALRLLQTVPDLAQKVTVSYLIDQTVPESLYQGPKALPGFPQPCATATSIKCFISFTPIDGGDERGTQLTANRAIIWTREQGYHSLSGAPFACVNPLTGGTDTPDALASLNRGSAAASGLERGLQPALLPGETGARCRGGVLLVEVNRPATLSRSRFELGSFYKLTSYNLFYAALASDVKARTNAPNAP